MNLINFSGGNNKDQRQEIGRLNLGNNLESVYRGMEQGNLKETGRTLDFALGEGGFFSIGLPDGTLAFTRSGNFKTDAEDYLVDMEGNPVIGLDENGNNIQIRVDNDNFTVDNTGNIMGGGNRLLIADFNDYENLNYIGENFFTSNEYNIVNGDVNQGYLEMSNVDLADQMIALIENLREFQANQRMMHSIDETLAKTVSEVGKV